MSTNDKPKSIDTLIDDIHSVLDSKQHHESSNEDVVKLADGIVRAVEKATGRSVKTRDPKTLYASEIGDPCKRRLWYKVHYPGAGEYLRPETRLKFLYGDIVEEVVLYLARTAGHKVEAEQESVVVELDNGWQVRGRLDAVIDNVVTDVKSASPFGYSKIVEEGLTDDNDSFGYRAQLHYYDLHMERNKHDTDTGEEDQTGCTQFPPVFLAVDKQNGKIGLSERSTEPSKKGYYDNVTISTHMLKKLTNKISNEDKPPPRGFDDEPWTNGNRKLSFNCSYCAFKDDCWPGLRVFAYAKGPVFATKVSKAPKNPEITEAWRKGAFKKDED